MTNTSHIRVTRSTEGATVSFPKNAAVIADLKRTFPKARWNPVAVQWSVPGVRAFSRLEAWAAKHETTFEDAARQQREMEAAGIETNPAKALIKRKSEIKSRLVTISDAGVVTYDFRYNAPAVAKARTLPGARYQGASRVWTFRPSTIADVDAIIDGCNEIRTLNQAAEAAAAAAKEEAAKAAAARRAEEDRMTDIWLERAAPQVGDIYLRAGQAVVVERIGRRHKVDTDGILVRCGNFPRTLDIEWCVRVYLREATAEEAARAAR